MCSECFQGLTWLCLHHHPAPRLAWAQSPPTPGPCPLLPAGVRCCREQVGDRGLLGHGAFVLAPRAQHVRRSRSPAPERRGRAWPPPHPPPLPGSPCPAASTRSSSSFHSSSPLIRCGGLSCHRDQPRSPHPWTPHLGTSQPPARTQAVPSARGLAGRLPQSPHDFGILLDVVGLPGCAGK